MGENQSNLDASKYGYDYVVATTQESINATMKEYLSGLTEPEVVMCYVVDANGNTTQVDYDTLVDEANGSDPFSIPDGADPATNQDLINLIAAGFLAGFKAQIGLPSGVPASEMPDIITLGTDTTSVSYTLLCTEFMVVQYTAESGDSPASWMNQSQPSDSPWLFTSNVDLSLSTTDENAYSSLPSDVQDQIKNLSGDAFSVQQLLFDLDNASLESIPTISGVEFGTTLYTALETDFLGLYFDTLQQNGQPVLGITITQDSTDSSTLALVDLNLEVSPYVDSDGNVVSNPTQTQQNLSTLNYLCATSSDTSLTPATFTWNWINEDEVSDYHGTIAVKSSTFISWLSEKFSPSLQDLCKQPKCKVKAEDLDTECKWTLGLNAESESQAYSTVSPLETDSDGFTQVLTFSYSKEDSSESSVCGSLKCTYTANSDVYFKQNQIKVVTTVKAHVKMKYEFIDVTFDSESMNLAYYQSENLFTLDVDISGKLVTSTDVPDITDNSDKVKSDVFNYIDDFDDIMEDEQDMLKSALNSFLDGFDADIQDFVNGPLLFVFPGSSTFVFKDVEFSDNQDLVSHITYANPS